MRSRPWPAKRSSARSSNAKARDHVDDTANGLCDTDGSLALCPVFDGTAQRDFAVVDDHLEVARIDVAVRREVSADVVMDAIIPALPVLRAGRTTAQRRTRD